MATVALYHWDSKGKAYVPRLLMAVAGIEYKMVRLGIDCDFETAVKPHTPFGQAPFLTHGPLKIGQSGAISRYIAKIGGLSGGSDADFAMSEMLLCETDDILAILSAAKYRLGNTAEAWDEALEVRVPPHYANLEKLLRIGSPYFTVVGPCAGDIAIFGALNIVHDIHPTLLSQYPKLEAFYTSMSSLPSLHGVLNIPIYFTRTEHAPAPAEEPATAPASGSNQSSMPISDYGIGISGRHIMQEPGGTSTLQLFG
eukprot:m.184162 g.184162  ORF g.184162 m.184162 type:complete len:255 (+) comp16052_c0_seq1:41-805(+)